MVKLPQMLQVNLGYSAGMGWFSSENVSPQRCGKFGDVIVKCGLMFTFALFVIVMALVFPRG